MLTRTPPSVISRLCGFIAEDLEQLQESVAYYETVDVSERVARTCSVFLSQVFYSLQVLIQFVSHIASELWFSFAWLHFYVHTRVLTYVDLRVSDSNLNQICGVSERLTALSSKQTSSHLVHHVHEREHFVDWNLNLMLSEHDDPCVRISMKPEFPDQLRGRSVFCRRLQRNLTPFRNLAQKAHQNLFRDVVAFCKYRLQFGCFFSWIRQNYTVSANGIFCVHGYDGLLVVVIAAPQPEFPSCDADGCVVAMQVLERNCTHR